MLHLTFGICLTGVASVFTTAASLHDTVSHLSDSLADPPRPIAGHISGYGEANSMGPPCDDEYDAALNIEIESTDDPGGTLCLNISKLTSGGGINGGITNYAIQWPRPTPVCAEYWVKPDCTWPTRNRIPQIQLSSRSDVSLTPRLIWPKITNTPVEGATCINSTLDAGAGFMIAPQGLMFLWNKRDCSHATSVYDGQYY